jgi:pimeloyl-ACP methyl ester carboxylesterase
MFRSISFTFFIFLNFLLSAQERVPKAFRMQEKKVTKRIHKYVHHDTLIETSGAYIHLNYSNNPQKPYLLLLHGMGVDGRTNWYSQLKQLSKHYNLIVPDLIYFGGSKSKKKDYSVEFQAEQIHEMLEKLVIESTVHVMGFSYGGLTAAVYNELYPNKKSKLILIDAPVKFYSTPMADSMANLCGVKSMSNIIVPQNLNDFAALEKAVLSRKFPISKKMKLKFISHYITPTLQIRQNQINYLKTEEKTYQNYTYHLESTKTLLIWGAKDGVVPLSVGEALNKAYPTTTQLLVFKKAKHDVHFRYSKKLNTAVLEFLEN